MAKAKTGDTVKIHYTGTLEDGSVFDSSEGRDPIEFTLGSGQVIAGFDSLVLGLEEGETKKDVIPMADAYGPHMKERVMQMDRAQFPEDMTFEVGQQLSLQSDTGQVVNVMVVEIGVNNVTLDGNHPMAGKDLTFEVKLVEIVKPN